MNHVSDVIAPYYVQQLANENTRPVVPLLEVIDLNPRKFSKPLTDDEPVSFVPMKAVEEETGHLDPSEARLWSEVRKGYTPFEEGDVIFAKITPCMENGKYALAQGLIGGRAAGSTEFHVLRPKPSLDSKYLLYYLLRIELRQSARQSMRGAAGQLRVPPIFFEGLSIPLPSIEEQRRIVAEIEERLSRLEAGVAALKRVQANLKRYRGAVAAAACEGKLTSANPNDWQETTLENLAARVTSGSRDWSKYYGRGSGTFILAQNVRPGRLDLSARQAVDPPSDDRDRSRSQVKEDDLLITIVGANTGDVCRVPTTLPEHYVCQSVGLVRLKEPTAAAYAELFLRSPEHGQRQFEAFIYGQGRPHLSFDQLKSTVLRLPPLAIQQEIVAEVDRRLSVVEELETQIIADLARATRLRQATLKRAFRQSDSTYSAS